MTAWEQALSEALLHFVWQGTAIAILLWVALSALRRSSPNARYVASCGALALLALMPVATAVAVYSPAELDTPLGDAARPPLPLLMELSSVAYPQAASWLLALKPWALPVWSAGVGIFGLRLIWSWSHTRKLRTTGTHADAELLSLISRVASRLGVTRKIQVLMSAIAEVPSAVGWLRPVLLLPAGAIAGLTPAQLEAVLAHELAHIRRHDYFVNLLQSLAEALLFYHPAVWWVSGRIRYERELCCDDLAVELCGDPVCYARALALLEKRRVLRPSLAMGSAGGPLVLRIRRLLMAEKREYVSWRLVCGLGLLAGVLGMALNAGWAKGQQQTTDRLAAELPRAETTATLLQLGDAQTSSNERIPTAQFLALLETTLQQNNGGPGPVKVDQFSGQAAPLRQAEDEALRRQLEVESARFKAEASRIKAEFAASAARYQELLHAEARARGEQNEADAAQREQSPLRSYNSALGEQLELQKQLLDLRRAFEQQIRDGDGQTQEIHKAFEQQVRKAEMQAQEINEDFEQQIRDANRQAEEISRAYERAFERESREPGRQTQEIIKAFEEQIREANERIQETNKVFEQQNSEAETRAQLEQLRIRLQMAEAELARARAELARERAVNANRAQPEVDRALLDAIEAGRAKPVQ